MSKFKHGWQNKESRFFAVNKNGVGIESHEKLVLNIAGHIEVLKGDARYEFQSIHNHSVEHGWTGGAMVIQRYTDQQMELEARNEGWVIGEWSENPIENGLMIDAAVTLEICCSIQTHLSESLVWCGDVIAYRLSNAEGYKDGVKVESTCHEYEEVNGDYILQNKTEWNGEGLPPVGAVCEITNNGQGMPADELNLDEHCIVDTWADGDAVRVLCHVVMHGKTLAVVQNVEKEQVSSIALKFIAPIRTHKERVIEAVLKVSNFRHAVKEDYAIECLGKIYDAGALSMPNDKEGE